LVAAMSEGLILTSADWIAVFRARIKELGLTHLEVDARAGLSEGHTGKVLCGTRVPSLLTIERLCRALHLSVAIESADGRSSFADHS
jgi:transcriptional regulator with XRE-family HTH domain